MPLKVMYIDDESMLCENFVDCFAVEGVEITTFTDPKKVLLAANTNPPDLIFIDYRLPGMNGDELATALNPKIPKYLITGEIDLTTKYSFLKIFPKPYDVSEISEIIKHYLATIKNDDVS